VHSGQWEKIDTLLSNMFDNVIRAVKTFNNKFNTPTLDRQAQLSANSAVAA